MGGKQKTAKVVKVQNKAPAPVQITAEQLLREAKERDLEIVAQPPKRKITDKEELNEYKLKQRKYFEDMIRKNRTSLQSWLRYAQFEDKMKEWQRARSVYERALDVSYKNIPLWLKYAEMEMRNGQVNHARNIWDRGVTILPRANQLWYKYVYMEEMLENAANCRQVFERWMKWEPDEQAWHSYINFELRYKEIERARGIYENFVMVHPGPKNWIKYARFEERFNFISKSREVFERAVAFYGDDMMKPKLFIEFAKFEERQKEYERARGIYKYSIDKISKEEAEELFKAYTNFEKRFGNRYGIENVIVSKRKLQYENEVQENPLNYDAWFDYLRLSEEEGNVELTRELYERAISNIPPVEEKRHWRRYIYLWIYYAVFEELVTKDMDRVRDVYKICLDVIPHKKFTFAKIWIMFAKFELRQKDVQKARKILGVSIGKCPKDKLFKSYIEMELELREFDRCRTLYDKFVVLTPYNCNIWCKYAELEAMLGDVARSRGIYEIAVNRKLDMPEMLWKAYIDFEKEQEEYEKVRSLYKRLLEKTQHIKVWLNYASFEASIGGKEGFDRTRKVYQKANYSLKEQDSKEERMCLLRAWKEFEAANGTEESLAQVQKQMPKQVRKRRKATAEDGSDAGWEEYIDYIFPEDEESQPTVRLLEMAKQWNKNTAGDDDSSSSDDSSSDEDD